MQKTYLAECLKTIVVPEVETPRCQQRLKEELLGDSRAEGRISAALGAGGLLGERMAIAYLAVPVVMVMMLTGFLKSTGRLGVPVSQGDDSGGIVEQVKLASFSLSGQQRTFVEWRLGMNLDEWDQELEQASRFAMIELGGQEEQNRVVAEPGGKVPGIELAAASEVGQGLGNYGVSTASVRSGNVNYLMAYTNMQGQRVLVGLDQDLVPVARQVGTGVMTGDEFGGQLNLFGLVGE